MPAYFSISEAKRALERGEVTSEVLVREQLTVIEKKNADIHAYLEVFDDVEERAREADHKRAQGEKGSLLGVPLAIKDNILIKGKHAGAASKILEPYTAAYNATVIEKLEREGAIFIGRTNLDEFAMGSSTEHSAFGATKNPVDPSRVPGGSSGGSAAAVAMEGALAALGSDTGGSIRQPACFCGIVGLKPTYGSVSRHGLIALGSSLDVIGPLTKSVADAELLFNVIRGHDPLDSTSAPDAHYARAQEIPKRLRIGVPSGILEAGVEDDVKENFEASLQRLRELGHETMAVELPHMRHSLAVYYIVMPAEASANLARFDGVRYGLSKKGSTLLGDYKETRGAGFGLETRRRILLGTYVLSAGYSDQYYHKARAVRVLIRRDFENAFKEVDLIATPTTPTPAFKLGEKSDPLSMYLADIFTVPANLAGIPGISFPSGTVNREGVKLPLGLQLLAPHFREDVLFRAGKMFLNEVS